MMQEMNGEGAEVAWPFFEEDGRRGFFRPMDPSCAEAREGRAVHEPSRRNPIARPRGRGAGWSGQITQAPDSLRPGISL